MEPTLERGTLKFKSRRDVSRRGSDVTNHYYPPQIDFKCRIGSVHETEEKNIGMVLERKNSLLRIELCVIIALSHDSRRRVGSLHLNVNSSLYQRPTYLNPILAHPPTNLAHYCLTASPTATSASVNTRNGPVQPPIRLLPPSISC